MKVLAAVLCVAALVTTGCTSSTTGTGREPMRTVLVDTAAPRSPLHPDGVYFGRVHGAARRIGFVAGIGPADTPGAEELRLRVNASVRLPVTTVVLVCTNRVRIEAYNLRGPYQMRGLTIPLSRSLVVSHDC